ncbi:DNA modification methylase, partial [Escherichia coli O111:H8 str. CVM9570]
VTAFCSTSLPASPSGWLFYVCSVKAAMSLGRRAIGVELETERFEQTVREVQDLVSQNG